MQRFFAPKMAWCLFALCALSSAAADDGEETALLIINDITIRVEVARTQEQRRVGLSGRVALPTDAGMLFVFQPPRKACLWMKDTKIPLQAFFLDAKGGVINAVSMRSSSKKIHCATAKVGYALEVNDGLFNKISDDMTVRGLPE